MKKTVNFIKKNMVTLFLAILFFVSLLIFFPNIILPPTIKVFSLIIFIMLATTKFFSLIIFIMLSVTLKPLVNFLLILYKFIIPLVLLSLLIYQLKTKKYDEKIKPIFNKIKKYDKKIKVTFNKIKNTNRFDMSNLLVCIGSMIIYFSILVVENINGSHSNYLAYLSFFEYFFLFLLIYAFINSVKRDKFADKPYNHFWYGLFNILSLSVLLLGFFSFIFYIIFQLSNRFLSDKDAFELSKWMIGLIGLGLSSFNIKLFVDYFRGAKVNAPYSLEQLQQLQILQKMQSNLENKDELKQELSQTKIMNEKDIKSQIEKVKHRGNL
ncbi:hypothetical protein FGL72_01365 [Leuconostoc citreum]|uniref:hypothetical protein n=1 Tax=Leuconostoc citreum TaxID=33964 RepID=UPI0011BBAA88|nr:hypothetical protein [Leuconostoc citreum]QEA45834.1 hypothetical protein FGL82_05430 [Leuconostoc citreum]QEA62522.1 hypothetical protein FGL72_01365 [Leuconostoc citreum]